MPLLFSRKFEHEAGRLRATAGRLATQIGASHLQPGVDILRDPAGSLRTML